MKTTANRVAASTRWRLGDAVAVHRHQQRVEDDDEEHKRLEGAVADEPIGALLPDRVGRLGRVAARLQLEQVLHRVHPLLLVVAHQREAVLLPLELGKRLDDHADEDVDEEHTSE